MSDRKVLTIPVGNGTENGGCQPGSALDILNIYVRNTDLLYTARQEINFLPNSFETGNTNDQYEAIINPALVPCITQAVSYISGSTSIPQGSYFAANVISATDYYPFGMSMPGRTYAADAEYRFGFNGKEKDKSINSLTAYDYGFRIYNPAIAKFLSVDPLMESYPMLTPYQFASNSPILHIDIDGLEAANTQGNECTTAEKIANMEVDFAVFKAKLNAFTSQLSKVEHRIENENAKTNKEIRTKLKRIDNTEAQIKQLNAKLTSNIKVMSSDLQHSIKLGNSINSLNNDLVGIQEDVNKLIGEYNHNVHLMETYQKVHDYVDYVGYVPYVGDFVDLLHACWYLGEGNYKKAAFTAIAAIPGVGTPASKVGQKFFLSSSTKFLEKEGYKVVRGGFDIFKDYNQARNAALKWLSKRGFKAEQPTIGKFGNNKGKSIGMSTADGKTGFRVEFDSRSGAHINVFSKKEPAPHFKFEGTQKLVDQLIKRFETK